MSSNLHNSYASDYDNQVKVCDCHIAEVLFGPGEEIGMIVFYFTGPIHGLW